MGWLRDKTVILGVTGSISAFKAASLASKLTQQGAKVDCILTANATKLIAPATFEAVTHRRSYTDTFATGEINHISVGTGADLAIVAPCSANVIGKLAHGIADDMLTTTLLAIRCPLIVSPAMNTHMYANVAVQENLAILRRRGIVIVKPAEGRLACGTEGRGRMPEPEVLIEEIYRHIALPKTLLGKHVVVSAGATREAIDAVRFISNPSTGKMGFACARVARMLGARVTLVTAASNREPWMSDIECIDVVSAQDMAEAMFAHVPSADIVVMAAAVSDFRPTQSYPHKVHKTDANLEIRLEPTTDILKKLGEKKHSRQFLCGFCMETEDLLPRARQKLTDKKLDLIIANDLNAPGCGFGHDTNGVTILDAETATTLEVMDKHDVAIAIFDAIVKQMQGRPGRSTVRRSRQERGVAGPATEAPHGG